MVNIGKVRMLVGYCEVFVHMFVCCVFVPIKIVRVIVMRVVVVLMRMCHRLMRVVVLVMFSQMQPHAHPHQRSGDPERRRCRFSEQQQ